jgi:phage terminase Nu1 subunit (DNA packaging protein)
VRLLSCWKDIANYFGKGVRTVQRWEALGMPVHRPNGDNSTVFADPRELKNWALRASPLMRELEKHLERELSDSERRVIRLAEEIIAAESSTAAGERE